MEVGRSWLPKTLQPAAELTGPEIEPDILPLRQGVYDSGHVILAGAAEAQGARAN